MKVKIHEDVFGALTSAEWNEINVEVVDNSSRTQGALCCDGWRRDGWLDAGVFTPLARREPFNSWIGWRHKRAFVCRWRKAFDGGL